jgi:hypothetical protein
MVTAPGQLSEAVGSAHETIALHDPMVLLTVMFAGQEMNNGASASFTVIVNEQIAIFPAASVAVYVIFVTPIGKTDPFAGPAVCITVTPAQLSLAVGVIQLTTALHDPGLFEVIIFNGQVTNVGFWLSVTVTVNEQVAVLPPASVAVKLTGVVPTGNNEPEGNPAVWVITTPGQLSLTAGAAQETIAPHNPGLLITLVLPGHEVNIGTWLSFTVTVNEQTLTLPLASVALYEIFVTPTGKTDPLGKPAVCVMATPAQLSLAVGATHEATELHNPGVLLKTMLDGQDVNTGSWLSVTVTVNAQTEMFPAASIAL